MRRRPKRGQRNREQSQRNGLIPHGLFAALCPRNKCLGPKKVHRPYRLHRFRIGAMVAAENFECATRDSKVDCAAAGSSLLLHPLVPGPITRAPPLEWQILIDTRFE